jgi:hypothetical protein
MVRTEVRRLTRKLVMLVFLVLCLTGLTYNPASSLANNVCSELKPKATKQICCSLCNGEPTDPGACRYGCNPDC